jgi:hypothetical protein
VIDDRHVEHARVLERPAHQQRSRHRAAIIGDRHAPGLTKLRDVGELLAFLTARHGTNGIDTRQVRLRGLFQNVLGHPSVVVHGNGVGHARDRGEAPGHGRCSPGRHGLLVLLTGFAQVHVHVDEAGTDDHVRRNLDHHRVRLDGEIPSDPRDPIAFEQEIESTVSAIGRIDDPSSFEQTLHSDVRFLKH